MLNSLKFIWPTVVFLFLAIHPTLAVSVDAVTSQSSFPEWMSILPPILAIVLALIIKEVVVSLMVGILCGLSIIGIYSDHFLQSIFQSVIVVKDQIANPDHASIILFSVLIGGVVAIIQANGGTSSVVAYAEKWANSRKKGMLTTWFLGVLVFFDDYANTLIVGNTMRPITDKLKISREKLAYLVDSTAAPMAVLAFITTWIGAELSYISDGLVAMGGEWVSLGSYSVFFNSLPYLFYPILTLFFTFLIAKSGKDFGPMLKAETKELTQLNNENLTKQKSNGKLYHALVPILVLVVGTIIGLYITGKNNLSTANSSATLAEIIGAADSYRALLWSSFSALSVAVLLSVFQRDMGLKKSVEEAQKGFQSMLPAVTILCLAWALASITQTMKTDVYLSELVKSSIGVIWVPAVTFVLAAFVAFATGSSWGTMALLFPVVLPLIVKLNLGDTGLEAQELLSLLVACIMGGSVLGDHCSPISDTTILSSLACSCDHIQHVKTQMPYALVVGGVSLGVGVIPVSLGVSPWICLLLGAVILYVILSFLGKKHTPDSAVT